jgi:erythromycin esterase-like protein
MKRFMLLPNSDRALRERLAEPRRERFIGVLYRPGTDRWSHYGEAALPDQFDGYVCWTKRTRRSPPAMSLTETFPFGN